VLAGKLHGVQNATVRVREWQGEVIFLHEVARGAADRSYGVQVARLAGLPPAVVARAREVLESLESADRSGRASAASLVDDLPLFSARAEPPPSPPVSGPSEVERVLATIRPDDLSPREALQLLYDLCGLLDPPDGA